MTTTTEGSGQGSAEGPLRGFDLDNIRKVYINQSGTLIPCIYIVGSGGASKYVLRAVGDGQIKIDNTDDPGYLVDKLVPGTNVSFSVSAGPEKTITINSSAVVSGSTLVGANSYTCTAACAVGEPVYLTGSNTVDQADATSTATAPILGFVLSKSAATTCAIAYYGELTGFVGLTPGIQYYLDTTPGQITTTAPSAAGNVVQPVGFARNTTTLVIMPMLYVVIS